MKINRGVSLIVLVITILVIIILAGAVILSLADNNPINSATEATFKSNLQGYKSELTLYLTSEYVKEYGDLDITTISSTKTTGTYDGGKTIQEIITSMSDSDASEYVIYKGKLVYIGTDVNKKIYAKEIITPDTYVKDSLLLWLNGEDFPNSSSSTLWIDKSGNNNHATVHNFDYNASSGSDGSGSVLFDGLNDYINLGNLNFSSLTNVTISFWRKSNVIKNWLLLRGNVSGTCYTMAVYNGSNFYHGEIGTNSKIYIDGILSTLPKDDNLWHHYLVTNVNLSSWTFATLSNYSSWQYYNYLGDLKIYNRPFIASEALNNFNAEKVKYGY